MSFQMNGGNANMCLDHTMALCTINCNVVTH